MRSSRGVVEPVSDFNMDPRADGSRPQQVDKESGLPLWQVTVLDADENAGKKDSAISLKILARVQPVPPENKSGLPFTPVEFVGLTALAYVEESASGRSRIAWSFRAEGLVAPGQTPKPQSSPQSSPAA